MTQPAPTEASLQEAALTHLARYSATKAGLVAVLDRRIARWARAEGAEAEAVAALRAAARRVADKLEALGLVNDAAFAAARAARLNRAGKSRRAVAAHLAARGIDGETARAVLPDDPEAELAAAVALAKRRRLGPFRAGEADAEGRLREMAVLARAGFGRDAASRALRMDREDAEALLRRVREG